MKKTLIALAVLGAASAAQAQSSLTIYGELNPSFDYVTVKEGPSFPGVKTKTTAMNNNASFIGFRGTEDLGGGLKAVFQLEAGYDMVNDGGMGVRTVAGDRNSFVGLEGRLGTVRFGAIDGAYKRSTASYDAFADTIGDYNSIIGIGQLSTWVGMLSGDETNNNTTYKQAIDYISPSYKGLQAAGTYALMQAQVDSTPVTVYDATAWDIGVNYSNGPLNLLATYSKTRDYKSSGIVRGQTTWIKVGAAYTFPTNTTVRAIVEKVKFDYNGFTYIDQRHWLVGVEHPINNVDLMANFIKAEDSSNNLASALLPTDQNGARVFNLGARYNFSKRTNVTAVYSYLKNDSQAGFANAAGYKGHTFNFVDAPGCYNGATISGVSVRLKHIF